MGFDLERQWRIGRFAMWKLEDRGPMMIDRAARSIAAMIIGEHTRENDLEINVLKGKAAHQYPRRRQRRGGPPHPADQR